MPFPPPRPSSPCVLVQSVCVQIIKPVGVSIKRWFRIHTLLAMTLQWSIACSWLMGQMPWVQEWKNEKLLHTCIMNERGAAPAGCNSRHSSLRTQHSDWSLCIWQRRRKLDWRAECELWDRKAFKAALKTGYNPKSVSGGGVGGAHIQLTELCYHDWMSGQQ